MYYPQGDAMEKMALLAVIQRAHTRRVAEGVRLGGRGGKAGQSLPKYAKIEFDHMLREV